MHAANPDSSARLKRVVTFLRARGENGATTWEIAEHCGDLAVHSSISECRARGYDIDCRYVGTTNGRRTYLYRLRGKRAEAA